MYGNQNGSAVSIETWTAALVSSMCIGLTSLVPWLFNLTFFERKKRDPRENLRQSGDQDNHHQDVRMKYLLSFAVGAILGDIFFHLIPESYQGYLTELNDTEAKAHNKVGLSIISGIFVFTIVEMMLEKLPGSEESRKQRDVPDRSDKLKDNPHLMEGESNQILIATDLNKALDGAPDVPYIKNKSLEEFLENNNDIAKNSLNILSSPCVISEEFGFPPMKDNNNSTNFIDRNLRKRPKNPKDSDLKQNSHDPNGGGLTNSSSAGKNSQICSIDVAGYLNLIANSLDNFTHGLAIGASFLAGPKVGMLTTFVIFIHEIPHEICDYAILVNSGFSRLEAVKAQSFVSLFGSLGTATALYVKSVEALTAKTLWILPFSAGGFLHIALVNLLPEILDRQTDIRDTVGQIACVILGVSFMALIAVL